MKHLLVYLCFFLSGISALIYQVVWVREFGNIFGNSVHSASIVIAVFMTGLGVGSYVAGRWADRYYKTEPVKPLLAYAGFEIGIALFGFVVALLLPLMEALSASISAYEVTTNGWHTLTGASLLYRYLIAVLLLAPSTLLMGGTLTLLIRYVVGSRLDQSGWKVGSLYGINTLGAAVGAFAVDFLLVPAMGLYASQMTAVLLNLLIGLVILRHAKSLRTGHALDTAAAASTAAEADSSPLQSNRLVLLTGIAIFLSGFAAMGMEIVWFRVLSSIFGQYRAIFSVLLTIILVGIWLGSLTGGYLHRRIGHAGLLYIASQSLFVVSAVLGLLVIDADLVSRAGSWLGGDGAGTAAGLLSDPAMRYSLLVLGTSIAIGLPAVMMGFAYPLANANIQRIESRVGQRSGILYFANTLGAVAGSIITGFYLLPALGSVPGISLLLLTAVSAIIPLALSVSGDAPVTANRRRPAFVAAAVAVPLLAIAAWQLQPADRVIFKSFYSRDNIRERTLASSEGILETLVIVDNRDQHKGKVLYTNGHSMSSSSFGSQRYMRAFVHVPLLQLDQPTDALVICFGVGNTLHAATLHRDLANIEVVDLSENVLRHAGYFADTNHGAIGDPRVSVFVNDGRQHLRMDDDERYDLVTLEPPPIVFAGVSALYSREFYALARQRLKPGGFVTQWLPYTQTSRGLTYSIIKAFTDVFPDTVMLAGSNADIILMGRKGAPNVIDPSRIESALARKPAVLGDLQAINMGTLTEFIGSFLGNHLQLSRLTDEVAAVTDDFPVMEYAPMYDRQRTAPAELIDVYDVYSWCPACRENGRPVEALANLPVYLQVMNQMFEGGRFTGPGLQMSFRLKVDAPEPAIIKAFQETPYLARLLNRGQTAQ